MKLARGFSPKYSRNSARRTTIMERPRQFVNFLLFLLINYFMVANLIIITAVAAAAEGESSFVTSSSSPSFSPESRPPPPVIYVSFTRWENRSFSPRLYYELLTSAQQQKLPGVASGQTSVPVPGPGPGLVHAPEFLNDEPSSPQITPPAASTVSVGDSPFQEPQPASVSSSNSQELFGTRANIQRNSIQPRPPPSAQPPRAQTQSHQFPHPIKSSSSIEFPQTQSSVGVGAPPGTPEIVNRFSFPQNPAQEALIYPTSAGDSGVVRNVAKKAVSTDKRRQKINLVGSNPEAGGAAVDNGSLTFYSSPEPTIQKPADAGGSESPGFQRQRQQLQQQRQVQQLITDIEVNSYALTFDIFRVAKHEWGDSNVLFSPFSFLNIMAILLLGSNGATFKELATQIRSLDPQKIYEQEKEYHIAFQSLLDLLSSASGENVALDIFNGIFVDKSFPLLASFRQDANQLYSAQTNEFDFGKDGEKFKKQVNDLVAFKTHDKIRNVISGQVDPSTTLALINTVYFRGSWEKPFMKRITKKRAFRVSPNETIQVDMMTNLLSIPYLETPSFRVVGLPYKGNKTGFFILLPQGDGVAGLQKMEDELNLSDFDNLLSMKETQVTLQMPKMRVEGENGEAKDLFRKLGIPSLFDPKTADLTKMSNTSGLYIKSIVHKAILDVDETGTEAAAVTIATGDRTFDDNPISFNANRPFAFCILHIKAKTVLFYGRVTRPSPLPTGAPPVAPAT